MLTLSAAEAASQIISITVDYSQSLHKMIRTSGFNIPVGIKSFTQKRFPVVGKGIVEFEAKLFHFNRDLTSEEACELIVSSEPDNPWELPGTEHVMAFGASFPQGKLEFSILCLLKNTDKNDPDTLGLWYEFEDTKFLVILGTKTRIGSKWAANYRFLASRKKRTPSTTSPN
ncbi:MAG: hypothetical protein ABI042_11680 [Verrucomicrobiota bacterium]